MKEKKFTWREIPFDWSGARDAWVGFVHVTGRPLWFFVKDLGGSFQAWVEWDSGHTVSCTMKERAEALEGARLELIDVTRKHCEDLLARFA